MGLRKSDELSVMLLSSPIVLNMVRLGQGGLHTMACRIDDVGDFVRESVKGFVRANPAYVTRCSGGVIRSTRSRQDQVALVVGGGMGHYPAFAGLVGPGMAHAAVLGNIFASPSTRQVVDVCRQADQGRGVLLAFGNYQGDLLNFSRAAEILRGEGMEVGVLPVTDDVYSAGPDEVGKRRGIAGDMAVFKIAGAAAQAGMDLEQVEEVAGRANDRTRSLGVAFSGCTLPGADEPLFEVPQGRMSLGLGIHGEPGIGETDLPTIEELAEILVDRLLRDVPQGQNSENARVAPILNGLGALKHDELFAVYEAVNRKLIDHELTPVDPLVGEFCTSFDMSGLSLSLCWLDDQLESLWKAPARTPSLHIGPMEESQDLELPVLRDDLLKDDLPRQEDKGGVESASQDSRHASADLCRIMERLAGCVNENVDYFGRIDSVAGDGDHGLGMQRGANAALDAVRRAAASGSGYRTTMQEAADAWADKAGGTSGALWGAILSALATSGSDQAYPSKSDIVSGWQAADQEVERFGGAIPGDKTMVDALHPFAQTLQEKGGDNLPLLWSKAAQAAGKGARDTSRMMPRKGRARAHGEKDLGTPDPGAISFAMIVAAITPVLESLQVGSGLQTGQAKQS